MQHGVCAAIPRVEAQDCYPTFFPVFFPPCTIIARFHYIDARLSQNAEDI